MKDHGIGKAYTPQQHASEPCMTTVTVFTANRLSRLPGKKRGQNQNSALAKAMIAKTGLESV